MACAVLVRPVLAPPLVVAGIAAAWLRRDRIRDVVLSGVLAAGVILAGFLPLIIDTGGLGPFLDALAAHGTYQERNVGLVTWTAGRLGLDFTVDGFWSAFFGALIISIVSVLSSMFVRPPAARA